MFVSIFFAYQRDGAMLIFRCHVLLKIETVVLLHLLLTWLAFLCNILYSGTSDGPTQYLRCKLLTRCFGNRRGRETQQVYSIVKYSAIVCLIDDLPLISPYGLLFSLQCLFSFFETEMFLLQVQIMPKYAQQSVVTNVACINPMESEILFLCSIFFCLSLK